MEVAQLVTDILVELLVPDIVHMAVVAADTAAEHTDCPAEVVKALSCQCAVVVEFEVLDTAQLVHSSMRQLDQRTLVHSAGEGPDIAAEVVHSLDIDREHS